MKTAALQDPYNREYMPALHPSEASIYPFLKKFNLEIIEFKNSVEINDNTFEGWPDDELKEVSEHRLECYEDDPDFMPLLHLHVRVLIWDEYYGEYTKIVLIREFITENSCKGDIFKHLGSNEYTKKIYNKLLEWEWDIPSNYRVNKIKLYPPNLSFIKKGHASSTITLMMQ